MVFKYKRFWGILLALAAAGLTALAQRHPSATERIYSRAIYPVFAGIFGRIFGVLPFSVAQWLVLLLPVLLLVYILRCVGKMYKNREDRRKIAARLVATLCCITGIVWFGFTVMCGLNYGRETFTAYSGLDVRPSSVQELAALCTELVAEANEYAAQTARTDKNTMQASYASPSEAAELAAQVYRNIGKEYPLLDGYCPRPKPVTFSRAMSWLNIAGIFTPYTFEANVNVDAPSYTVPASMMHELAHFKGFMREDEANFIAYLGCKASGNSDFAYSGTMLALVCSTNALYNADREQYWLVAQQMSDEIKADLAENQAYWRQFEGPAAKVSEKVNDVYLKTNNQPAGIKSYGRMVDLLLAEYRQRYEIE